jgi:DNA-binding NarL/FixJ family response regulator
VNHKCKHPGEFRAKEKYNITPVPNDFKPKKKLVDEKQNAGKPYIPSRAGTRWTVKDENDLLDHTKNGHTNEFIAKQLGRSIESIEKRIEKKVYDYLDDEDSVETVAQRTGLSIDMIENLVEKLVNSTQISDTDTVTDPDNKVVQTGGKYIHRATDDSQELPNDYVLLPSKSSKPCASHWSNEQEEQLLDLVAKGFSNNKIGKMLNRPPGCIHTRLAKLGNNFVEQGMDIKEARDKVRTCF